MKGIKTIKELKKELSKANSGCASDTILMAKATLLFAEKLNNVESYLYQIGCDIKAMRKQGRAKTKSNPSEYNLFIGEQIGRGKTFLEAINEWKEIQKQLEEDHV